MATTEFAVVERPLGRMSGVDFRAFQETRPDHERWELIDGVPVMMTPPTLAHNLIATNLQFLLLSALRQHHPSLVAVQRPGLDINDPDYQPEPDVAVIDADFKQDDRIAAQAYLLAEIVSNSDQKPAGLDRQWIDEKRELYRGHKPCQAVLIISQDHMDVELDLRTETGWTVAVLQGPDAELSIPAFGLRCTVADLYEQTPLAHGNAQRPRP